MNKLVKAAAVTLGGVALIGAVSGTAQAATSPATADAPGCVTLDAPYTMFGGMVKATVTNGCTQPVNVRIVYPNGPGRTCHTVAPQQSVVESYWSFGFGWTAKSLISC
ncbi:hypothetical protein [Streptomyces cinnamoneus]|uniref:Beta-Ig-H3/fasciclin n=1 Tax=Streptomyces cinnamoneus TaxID=53446 RepID=A0A918TZG5_STRCJ|nr:hypothetical protein [Streptomyces cinnamoneus]GHC71470.1 hypothetical protein GCM10010507_58030 [Streptomyces cinnamoneus]